MKNLKCFFTNVFESVSCFMNREIVLNEVGRKTDTTENVTDENTTNEGLTDLRSQIVGADGNPIPEAGQSVAPDQRAPETPIDTTTISAAQVEQPQSLPTIPPAVLDESTKAAAAIDTSMDVNLPAQNEPELVEAPAESHPGTVQPNAAPAAEPQEPVEQQKPTQQESDFFAEQEARKRAVQKGRSEIAANFETNN